MQRPVGVLPGQAAQSGYLHFALDESTGHLTPFVDADALAEAEVIAFCRDRLAHYKCPRRVVFTELPKTATGKIQKFRLRELAGSREAIARPR